MPLNLADWEQTFAAWEDVNQQMAVNPQVTLAALVHINLADLTTALLHHASLYAFFAARMETRRVEMKKKGLELEIQQAKASSAITAAEPKLAVDKVKAQVSLDPEVQRLEHEYLEAEHQFRQLDALIKSLEHRRDMLVQLSAQNRQERFNS